MRYVLPWSGDRSCRIYVWNRLAARQSAPILSAGVADCTGSDRGRAVPAAVLVRKAAGQVSTEGRGRKN